MTLPLALLPFEGMGDGDMADLATVLDGRGFACTVLPQMAIPAGAYDRLRDQYRVGRLLEATRQAVTGRVLGVADADLYAEGLNFVFGMADSPGRAALERAMRDHMLVDGGLVGICQRRR